MLFICSTFTKSCFPSTFNDFFKTIKNAHRYETILTSKKSYYLPKARTNCGKFNIQFNGAKVWNSVPEDLKPKNRSCFKKFLKESIHVISKY